MRKKLLIASAAAVAGMLALSPLAFANDYNRDRDRGGNETTSFSFEDDSVQRNQVNLCSSDQDAEVLPSTVVGAILPSLSQDQNGNCVNIADGVSEPTAPPTTTPAPPPPLTEQVTPPADRADPLPDGRYAFGWDRDLPPGLMDADTTFVITQACPDGWTPTVLGQFTPENAANTPRIGFEIINSGQGVRYFWIGNAPPPAEPSGITYVSACEPPA